ncbi:MAG: S24 family peptidase [Longimicrobiales bacterium]|nr:S24 family peptidase [Longimicrobiales bacterium]
MAQSLSETERRILDFMVGYLRENTYQPSIREIGEEFGIRSTKTVSEHLQALAEKGFLERDPSRSRGVRILGVDLAPEAVSIPLLTDLPDDRTEPGHAREFLTIDRRLAGSDTAFFVRARGDQLAYLGGGEGDYLLIEPSSLEGTPAGSVIAARIGRDEPAFYRVRRREDGLELQSLSGGPAVRCEAPGEVKVIGRVIALHRRLDASSSHGLTAH